MYRLKNINKYFFRNKHPKVLVRIALIGTAIITGTTCALYNGNKHSYGEYNGNSEPKYEDRIIWSTYEPERTEDVTFTYYPSNIYKIRIFKGKSQKTHYRVEVVASGPDGIELLECSEWIEIPTDGLITIDRSEFSDNHYNHQIRLCYGIYEDSLGRGCDNENLEYSDVFNSNCSKEDIEKFNKFREQITEGVIKRINKNDSQLDKVKKTYDYIISHIDYHFVPVNFSDIDINTYTHKNFIGMLYTDCSGYTDIFNYVFNEIGIESYTVVDNTNGHVWNMVKVDGKYYHLDATYSDTGSYTDTSKYRYFLVSDEFMRAENRWFIKEKDFICDEIYNLTGIVDEDSVAYRGLN